jgi:hypothetical protein
MSGTSDNNLNVSSPQQQIKPKRKKPVLGLQNVSVGFEGYGQKYFYSTAQEHPEWSDDQVMQYLRRQWDEMDELMRMR